MSTELTRRRFIQSTTAAALATTLPALAADTDAVKATPSYNPNMDYRRLGKTNLYVSAICMGGHWKRVNTVVNNFKSDGYEPLTDELHPGFEKNRYDTLSRCIEHGINLVDACSAREICAYARALKGRRDKMLMTFSWFENESRFPEWRTAAKLLQGLENGMKIAGLDHVDIWRISALMDGSHTPAETEAIITALDTARKQGKVRFTGVSSHSREWLKMLVEKYPDTIQVIVTPYTADSKVLPTDSLFDAVKQHDVGVLGIKPFASNSLFKGTSALDDPNREEDDKRARLALRYILCNPAITAPIPGLINNHQVDNVVAVLKERRQLDLSEKAELDAATKEMWARLPEDYHWLNDWRHV
ncbi:MAG: aldo/keto reductase [Planctomycetota bacterium]|nr:aldo/keto reductase [Planctomycetota bacterium]